MKISIQSFLPAVVFTIFATVLFCLPGKSLPSRDWFEVLQVDKWVHVVLFLILTFLWCAPLLTRSITTPKLLLIISAVLLGYGVIMECVQYFFIMNRSFDTGDIAADAMGCLIGFFFAKKQWKPS